MSGFVVGDSYVSLYLSNPQYGYLCYYYYYYYYYYYWAL